MGTTEFIIIIAIVSFFGGLFGGYLTTLIHFKPHVTGVVDRLILEFKTLRYGLHKELEQTAAEFDVVEAQSCGRDCGNRKPTSVINEEKLDRIGEKSYIKKLEESKVLKEKIDPCDCGDGCEKCDCAEDEQDETEAQEEVADANQEAAESAHSWDGNGDNTVYIPGDLSQVNKNHKTAAEKVNAVTKNALKVSIKDGGTKTTLVAYPQDYRD